MKIYRALKTNFITQGYGVENTAPEMLSLYKSLGMLGHNGIDFACWSGEPIYHCGDFTGIAKTEVDSKGGIGVDVISKEEIEGGYFKLRYWHLKKVNVYDGQEIKEGDLIGWGDNTGLSTGDHLHLGLKSCHEDGEPLDKWNGYYGAVDPSPYYENVFVLDILEVKQEALSVIQLAQKLIAQIGLWLLKGRSKKKIKNNNMENNNMKKWYQSKTVWIAILQSTAGIIAAFITQHPEIAYLVTGKSIIDVLIRVVTEVKVG